MVRRFDSIGFADTQGYLYDSDIFEAYSMTHPRFRVYPTYGDAGIQHAAARSVDQLTLIDYLFSLAQAMETDGDLAAHAEYMIMGGPLRQKIEFAASLVWKGSDASYDKRRFFSMAEEKISKKPALEHDRRYRTVEKWMDGKPSAIYNLLVSDHHTNFERFLIADAVRDWCIDQTPSLHMEPAAIHIKWFKETEREQARALRSAVQSARYACKSWSDKVNAKTLIESYRDVKSRERQLETQTA